MNIEVWTLRTPAHHLRSLALAAMVVALAGLMAAQSVRPISQNGRVVWTNDEVATAPAHAELAASAHAHATERAQQAAGLFYWSKAEKRWKRVSAASPSAMRSAKAVVAEVSSYIDSHPHAGSHPAHDSGKAQVNGEIATQNTNHSRAAGNRSVGSAQIDRYINEAAARHHVDPNLVRALVKVESNFNPSAVSRKGAMGLMQLMPATARMYDLRNPFDAEQNVEAGVRHLKGLLENFRGDVSLSLAAYNAGQGAVERNKGIPPYTETRNYVKRITNLMGTGSEMHVSSLSVPIHISRDERGRLVLSNID
jgi:soluble lytic murein transglycosylase-like protein